MSTPKHTPGPWYWAGNGPWVYAGHDKRSKHASKRECVAEVCSSGADWHRDDVEANANARLIAAAPELLAASERALELLRSITNLPSDLAPFRETAAKMLNEAIAKATGGDL